MVSDRRISSRVGGVGGGEVHPASSGMEVEWGWMGVMGCNVGDERRCLMSKQGTWQRVCRKTHGGSVIERDVTCSKSREELVSWLRAIGSGLSGMPTGCLN